MTLSDARTLANVNARSQRLFEDGYHARRLPRLLRGQDGNYPGDHDLVQVTSPEGEAYEVALPTGILARVNLICPDYLPPAKTGMVIPPSPDSEGDWLDLSAELTARQEEFNLLGIGNCTCPFWWQHAGRYWCKHYLGAPLLLAHAKTERMKEEMARAIRVVDALRNGMPLRLCDRKGARQDASYG